MGNDAMVDKGWLPLWESTDNSDVSACAVQQTNTKCIQVGFLEQEPENESILHTGPIIRLRTQPKNIMIWQRCETAVLSQGRKTLLHMNIGFGI